MHNPYLIEIEVPRPATLGGGAWHLQNLSAITALFGKNGSGKSQLLRALRDTDAKSRHYVIPERTGEIDYQPNLLQSQIDAEQRRSNSARNYTDQYRRHIIVRIQAYFSARGNTRGHQLPGDPVELERFIGQLLPDFVTELSGTKNPPYTITRASNGTSVSGIDQLSSGEAQLLTIALDILTISAIWDIEGQVARLMLIDEPDAHIHPDLQVRFADFLVQVTERYKLQVLLATHSTSLLAALGQFGADNTSIIYLDRTKTVFRAESFTAVMKELAACLGGHALMGPLFSSPLLLVEGDDDYRIWSQIPRHHVVNFAVIPSSGDQIHQYQRSLEKVFRSLRETGGRVSGYALIDGDKPSPQPNPQAPQDYIRYIRLNCHESENLYLTDEVLALFGTNWTDAAKRIGEAAQYYGAKESGLRTVAGLEAEALRNTDIKNYIHQIAEVLDPKKVHWTVRVAQAIGRARPTGQIEDYLGKEVVSTLWGVT